MEKVAGEVININNEYKTYQDYKAAVDCEMQKSAESFVRIGYLLKLARDTDILKDTPYGSVNEFARQEYGLDKSQVSRFIRINDEYSEGGYSGQLMEKYRGYGYAKLALMLLLPAAIAEEISPGYSKSEIQAVKEEIDEEKKVSDIEVMLEGRDQKQESMDSTLDKVIHQLGHDHPELYAGMFKAQCEDYPDPDESPMGQEEYTGRVSRILSEILAPSGEAIHSVRLRGTGRMIMSIKGADREITVVNVRSGEKESFSWQQMAAAVDALVAPGASSDYKKEWELLYGEAFPARDESGQAEPAPVQTRPAPRKQGRVTRARTTGEEKAGGTRETENKQENIGIKGTEAAGPGRHPSGVDETTEKEDESKPDTGEGGVPGQMQIEKDFPEYCPGTENTEVAPVQPESGLYEKHLGELKYHLDEVYKYAEAGEYKDAQLYMMLAETSLKALAQLKTGEI